MKAAIATPTLGERVSRKTAGVIGSGRIVEATRPKYTADGLPAVTPLLAKIGVTKWCSTSDPEFDCTGSMRLTRSNCRLKKANGSFLDPKVLLANKRLVKHRRVLQKVAFELWEHYPELRVADIGFIMGYQSSQVSAFMHFIPPQGL